MEFERGFLRSPRVKAFFAPQEPIREEDEQARIAESNEEIYLRAIRRMWAETEGMK